ncbi:hypothetical protein EV121DRAFT_278300 [Schizophyllum commune]
MSAQLLESTDTPRKAGSQHPSQRAQQNANESGVMQLRAARNYTRECPVDEFYKAYVETKKYARVADRTMGRIMSVLRDRRAIVDGEWVDLHRDDQDDRVSVGENKHFKNMEVVFAHVLEAAAEVCPARYATAKKITDFACRPDCQTASEVPGASFRVDALNYLCVSSYPRNATAGTAHNYTAAVPGQVSFIYTADSGATWDFKMWEDESSVLRNEQQTLNTAQHMLYNDIRRTCHFSVTIERTTARIWYHTRSHTIVTKGFDIHTAAEQVVQFILFSTFATPFQLGFDPTVRRVVVDDMLHYEFEVIDLKFKRRIYRTVMIEHENPAAELYSRAMRVFKVVECGVEHDYVLRDYWLFDDDLTSEEWKIQSEILKHLAAKLPKEEYEKAKRHFLTIIADGVVHHRGGRDAVPSPPESAEVYEYANELNPKSTAAKKPTVSMANRGEGAAFAGPEEPTETPPTQPLILHGRKHCRTVYLEHCQDLWQVKDPAMFFFALYQLMYILDMLRRAGYMHRDVSLGNVMLQLLSTEATCLAEKYITKIADLEYARAYSRTSQHDPITGTSLFMSVELQARAHQFRNKKIKGLLTSGYFAYSFLHDVESVLWMALYFAYRRCSRAILESTPWEVLEPRLKAVKVYASQIFVDSLYGSQQRDNVFTEPYNAENIVLPHLRALYGDNSPMTKLASLIDSLRETYELVEDDTTVRLPAGAQIRSGNPKAPRLAESVYEKNAQIYDTMAKVFDEISQHFYSAENADELVQFSDIDFTTGKIIVKPAAPKPAAAPVATVADGAAAEAVDGQATGAPKKLTGKRKKDAEDEARGKKRASAKRSGADASAQRAGTAGPSGSQPATRGKTRAKSNTKPAAAGKRSSGRNSGRLSKRNSAQDPA